MMKNNVLLRRIVPSKHPSPQPNIPKLPHRPPRSIPIPDPNLCDITPLVQAFDALCNAELLPWAQMDKDPVRHRIDDAVAQVLELDPAEMSDWRQRIVNEPTVSNQRVQ